VSRWNGDDTTAFVQTSWHALTIRPLAIDDFHIVAHCSNVANETVNWGVLKSEYR